MPSLTSLLATSTSTLVSLRPRDDTSTGGMSPALMDGLIALLVLIFASLLLVAALFAVRRVRRRRAVARQSVLPIHTSNHKHSHSRLTITSSRHSNFYIYDEKRRISSGSASPTSPTSPSVPEIRITFPDEQDEAGHRRSGRVVVVRVGERSIGLEPLDEQLPAYEKESGQAFHSIDMDRIGGLKEKSVWS